MKSKKAFTAILLLTSILLSFCSCKKDGKEAVFENEPFVAYASYSYHHGYPYQAKCEFEHSVYKYYDDSWMEDDDGTPSSSDHVPFTFYFGWDAYCKDAVVTLLGTDSISSTSIYFKKDDQLYLIKEFATDFLSDGFKYFTVSSDIVSFNFHEHLVIPRSLYNGCEDGQIDVCVYYEADGVKKPLMSVSIYFERHGDELWFASDSSKFEVG